jgi:hypothetical protein
MTAPRDARNGPPARRPAATPTTDADGLWDAAVDAMDERTIAEAERLAAGIGGTLEVEQDGEEVEA